MDETQTEEEFTSTTVHKECIYEGKSTLGKVFIWIWSTIGAILFFIIAIAIESGEFLLEVVFHLFIYGEGSVELAIIGLIIILGLIALAIVTWILFRSGRFVKHAREHGFMNAVTGNIRDEEDEHIFDAATLERIQTMQTKKVNYNKKIKHPIEAQATVYSTRKVSNAVLQFIDRIFDEETNENEYQVHVFVDGVDNFLRAETTFAPEETPYRKGDKVTVEYDSVKPAKCRIIKAGG